MAKVMVIDDDATMASLLETLLKLDGHEVVKGESVQRFIEQVHQAQPDLILMDVFLQDAEGYDLVRSLRAQENSSLAQLPVIMTSGMELSYECREAGADAFLLKPYDPDQLLHMINKNLGAD
jgi:CheY-like chemotaxis protein